MELVPRTFNLDFCGVNGTLGFSFFKEELVKPHGYIENLYRKAVLHLCHPDHVIITADRIADKYGIWHFSIIMTVLP